MLAAEGIERRIGGRLILRGVDLVLEGGHVHLLLGPNGAGKSTLLRILALLDRPRQGRILLHGRTIQRHDLSARRAIGLLGHQGFLYEGLTALENLAFYSRLYGMGIAEEDLLDRLDEVGLLLFAHDRVRIFSRGMRQRLALARVFLHHPSVLLLDEPYTGLDAEGILLLDRMLREAREQGTAVLLVTHDLGHALALADRFSVLDRGEMVEEGMLGPEKREDFLQRYTGLLLAGRMKGGVGGTAGGLGDPAQGSAH